MSTTYHNKAQFQRNNAVTTNPYNEPVDDWQFLKDVFGKFFEQTGRESATAGAINGVQTAQFETWYQNVKDVTELDRFVYRGRTWNIYSIQRMPEINKAVIQAETTDDNS